MQWKSVMQNNGIFGIRDPITGSVLDKKIFYESFQLILEQLTGEFTEDSVEYFFTATPLNPGILEFVGEDEKMEFVDWAIDHQLLPHINEIKEGEGKLEKEQRQTEQDFLQLPECQEDSVNSNSELSDKGENPASEKHKSIKVAQNMYKSISKMLTKSTYSEEKYNRSVSRLKKHLQDSCQRFPNEHQLNDILNDINNLVLTTH